MVLHTLLRVGKAGVVRPDLEGRLEVRLRLLTSPWKGLLCSHVWELGGGLHV